MKLYTIYQVILNDRSYVSTNLTEMCAFALMVGEFGHIDSIGHSLSEIAVSKSL